MGGRIIMARKGVGTRKFNGKTYHPQEFYSTKGAAKLHAERLRRHGMKARVIKVGNVYGVWFTGQK